MLPFKNLIFSIFFLFPILTFGQGNDTLSVTWQKNFGGSGEEKSFFSIESLDDGYFAAGTSLSSNDDLSGNLGLTDIFLTKINNSGTPVWKKRIGGSLNDEVLNICLASDGNLMVLINSLSVNGDFVQSPSVTGLWLFKINGSNGNIIWKANYGGNSTSFGKIIKTSDDGFAFVSSFNTVVSGLTLKGGSDIRLIKTNSSGVLSFQNNYGGSLDETAKDILEYENAFYILGNSNSPRGMDIDTTRGGFDIFLVKTNLNGLKLYAKTYGGSSDDVSSNIIHHINDFGENIDYMAITGTTSSNNGDIFISFDGKDIWLFQINKMNGEINPGPGSLNTNIGSSLDEVSSFVSYDASTDSFILTATVQNLSWLNPIGVKDVVVLKINALGGIDYQKLFGGTQSDSISVSVSTDDRGIVLSGLTKSSISPSITNKGGYDFWISKLDYPCKQQIDLNNVLINRNLKRYASQKINSESQFTGTGNRMTLQSAAIELRPGFSVAPGVVFVAKPGNCPNSN